MMAKMFYTLDETKSALGRNEEEIKQLSREGAGMDSGLSGGKHGGLLPDLGHRARPHPDGRGTRDDPA